MSPMIYQWFPYFPIEKRSDPDPSIEQLWFPFAVQRCVEFSGIVLCCSGEEDENVWENVNYNIDDRHQTNFIQKSL